MKLMEGILGLAKELGFYNICSEETVIIFEQGNDMSKAMIKKLTWKIAFTEMYKRIEK